MHGHDGGVLSLSWCPQDNDLLLSCGKDNRLICWNPQTGDSYGEFSVVTNWTFQTRWNPHNPNLLATASFDGKIGIQSIQNTRPETGSSFGGQTQTTNDEDFFNKVQSQPQGASFTLSKAPKWLQVSCGATFGFGGKLLSFTSASASVAPRHSTVRLSSFAIDGGVSAATQAFEDELSKRDFSSICKTRVEVATSEAEKADWKVIETLTLNNPRKELIRYLGFSNIDDEAADGLSKLSISEAGNEDLGTAKTNGTSPTKTNRLSAFFESNNDNGNFLSDLAATKGAKTNNPFQIYSGSELEPERRIIRHLALGQFDKALDVCLQEDQLSDAFMIAICGGQACIDKVQKAYFSRKTGGPNFLRLLASVVGKNLWDVVYNADLDGWKEVMAILCTYASVEEFPDLCEALGDRLEEQAKNADGAETLQKEACFCYLAGSKLEKVVTIWIAELDEHNKSAQGTLADKSDYSVQARSLQGFIEKVTVFREVTGFQDDDRLAASGWKIATLYDKYTEYADIVASHGQLEIAEKYLNLLPAKYPAAEIARNRVKEAIGRPKAHAAAKQPTNSARSTQRAPSSNIVDRQDQQNVSKPQAPGSLNVLSTPYLSQQQNPQAPMGNSSYPSATYSNLTGNQQPNQSRPELQQQFTMGQTPIYGAAFQNQNFGPPPRKLNASPSIPPPSQAQNMSNWNDTPESFFKPPTSRRGTPSTGGQPLAYPANVQPNASSPYGFQSKNTPPLPPPPKGPVGASSIANSPSASTPQTYQSSERPPSSVTSVYAPQNPVPSLAPASPQGPIPRGPSPYHAPPSAPPLSNRYAPTSSGTQGTPLNQSGPVSMPGPSQQRPPPPTSYTSQQNYTPRQQSIASQSGATSSMPSATAPPSGLSGPVSSQGPPLNSRPGTAQLQRSAAAPAPPKYRMLLSYITLPC